MCAAGACNYLGPSDAICAELELTQNITPPTMWCKAEEPPITQERVRLALSEGTSGYGGQESTRGGIGTVRASCEWQQLVAPGCSIVVQQQLLWSEAGWDRRACMRRTQGAYCAVDGRAQRKGPGHGLHSSGERQARVLARGRPGPGM
jgi:hypothetical protein